MPSRNSILKGLEAMERTVEQALKRGLQDGAVQLTAAMQDTDAHGDKTGATRASYVAYEGNQANGAFGAALAAARALNPGGTASESIDDGGPDTLTVVATSATNYQQYLEMNGHATIGPLFDQYAGQIAGEAFEAVKKAL